MSSLKSKKGVLLDFGDTIASTIPSYQDRIKIALHNLGFDFSAEDYFNEFLYADYVIFKNYIKEGVISSSIYQNTLLSVLIENLNLDLQHGEASGLIRKEMNNIEYTRELMPGAVELLDCLHDKGYKLGLISNNDGKTRQKCEELGIQNYFKIIIDSTNVKKVKPDKKIFDLASGGLGIDTKHLVYIGDLYGADIMGGINAGIDVIWINHRNSKNYEGADIRQVENLFELKRLFD